MRVRVAGIIFMENGIALMHRTNNMENDIHDYYVFPGGGLEDGETIESGVIREVKEEFGIDVVAKKTLYVMRKDGTPEGLSDSSRNDEEYFILCEYVGGVFGTGDGPEFNHDPKYANRGEFTPVIIDKDKINDLVLLPAVIKRKLVADINNNII